MFKCINDKHLHKFQIFDIKDFYPSITEKLMMKALTFAQQHVKIKVDDFEVLHHARKSLLFNNGVPWSKKDGLFDVTMGAYDGAELCELVGNYLLSILASKYEGQNIGLYRDDGLAVFKNTSGLMAERIKKDFTQIFKKNGLEITIECNVKIVNYLDVTLNLNDGSYRPYKKPTGELRYIHTQSNPPPATIRQIPISVEKRLNSLSSSKVIFDEAVTDYSKALKESGFNDDIKYCPIQQNNDSRKQRKRKVTWFNPPYSTNVETNVAKQFLKLVDKHFPKESKLHKVFNRNNLKVSYSCMPNIASIIAQHNKSMLNERNQDYERTCNCRDASLCPLEGKCLISNVVYTGTISSPVYKGKKKAYIGVAQNNFKERNSNHLKSFNNEEYVHDTALSLEVWRLKNLGHSYSIAWSILRKTGPYNPHMKKCSLCLNEKLEIVTYKGTNELLNKRSELVSKCRHRNKYSLSNG